MVQNLELFCLSLAWNKPWLNVRHQLPGRLRLGLEPGLDLEGLTRRIGAQPSVVHVEANPVTHSLVIQYTGAEHTLLSTLYNALPNRQASQGPARIEAPLREGYQKLDRSLRRLTGNWLDIRAGLALSVGLLALSRPSRAPFMLWTYSVMQQVVRE